MASLNWQLDFTNQNTFFSNHDASPAHKSTQPPSPFHFLRRKARTIDICKPNTGNEHPFFSGTKLKSGRLPGAYLLFFGRLATTIPRERRSVVPLFRPLQPLHIFNIWGNQFLICLELLTSEIFEFEVASFKLRAGSASRHYRGVGNTRTIIWECGAATSNTRMLSGLKSMIYFCFWPSGV